MNKVYESDKVVIHDDREPLTFEQAFELLWAGLSVRVSYPIDYTDEEAYFDLSEQKVFLTDIVGAKMPKQEAKKQAYEYLRGYEIYK